MHKLIEALQKFDAQELPLSEVVKAFVHFFEHWTILAERVPENEKEVFVKQFSDISQKILTLIDPYIDAIPLPEETLINVLDNPNYFDEKQRRAIREGKEQLADLTRRMLPHLARLPTSDEPTESLKTDKKKSSHTPRSKWMKT